MKKYRPKQLIDGFKLGSRWGEWLLVAIPKQYIVNNGHVEVIFDNVTKNFSSYTPMIEERSFKDKFGRGEYTLCYYEWKKK